MDSSAFCVDRGHLNEINPAVDKAAEFAELLSASSLGTDEARAARLVGARTLAEFEPEVMPQEPVQHDLFSFAAMVYKLLGQRFEAQGKAEEAELCYRTALINRPDGNSAALLAAILESSGNREEAASWYVRAAERANPAAAFRLAVLCYDTGHFNAALLMRTMAQAQLDPHSRHLVQRYVRSGKHRRSKMSEVIGDPRTMFYVASYLHVAGDFPSAYKCYSQSVESNYRLAVLGVRELSWRAGSTLAGKTESCEERRSEWFKWSKSNPAGPPNKLDPLVTAAVNGDRKSTDRLLGLLRPLVVRYCRSRVGRQERTFASADDVAQEVCLAVFRALPGYRDHGRPFLAFVYGIAAHKVADAHRSSARNRADPMAEVPDAPEFGDNPETRVIQGELATRMEQLMAALAPKQQEILRLRFMVGLSAEETAEAVGSTPGAVRVAQHRALTRLRKMLATEEVV